MDLEKIKLVTMDGDGCTFSYDNIGSRFNSSWDAIGHAFGFKQAWDERKNLYYKINQDDHKWAMQDALDLKGKSVEEAIRALTPVPYTSGVREFAEKTRGLLIRGLLSTCIDLVAEQAQKELRLDFVFCNVLHRNNGFFTGGLDYNVPLWRKHEKIEEICEKYEVNPYQVAHIGDNENDISVRQKVAVLIALQPDLQPRSIELIKAADYVVKNFFEVLSLFAVD